MINIATLLNIAMPRPPQLMPSCVQAQVLVPGSSMIVALLPLATVLTAFAFGISTIISVDICDNVPCYSHDHATAVAIAVLQTNSVPQSATSRCCRCVSNKRCVTNVMRNATALQMKAHKK